MEMTGEYRIPATREAVWEALNDPAVLSASIPGCKLLERSGENGFAATVQTKIGPVKVTFKGKVTLSDIDPPNGYRISGEGKGGPAGFAKGGATVSLREEDGETVLSWSVDASVGGKLAQIGARLIDSTAKKLAGEFFDAFVVEVSRREGGTAAMEPPVVDAPVSMPVQNAAAAARTAGDARPAANDSGEPVAGPAPVRATDAVAKKRRGAAPVVWTLALVVVVIVLIAAFSGE